MRSRTRRTTAGRCATARPAVLPLDFNTTTPLDSAGGPRVRQPGQGPLNTSRWNTGPRVEPPPITAAEMWYSFTPENSATPRSARRASTYYNAGDHLPATLPRAPHRWRRPARRGDVRLRPDLESDKFPPYYDGTIFFGEFTRDYLRRSGSTRTARSSRSTTSSTAGRRPRRRPAVRVRQPDGHPVGRRARPLLPADLRRRVLRHQPRRRHDRWSTSRAAHRWSSSRRPETVRRR